MKSLIDEFVSCELPEEQELRQTVQELQSHKCTKTCKKKGPNCRFGFPRLPSKRTLISLPVNKEDKDQMDNFKYSKGLLQKMRDYLQSKDFNKDLDLDAILNLLKIDPEEYEQALVMSERGKQVVLKRKPSECFINNYNRRFLLSYQANMDIQFCLDSYAVVTYVCDYWSKDETGMTEFLKEALKEAKSLKNKELLSHLKRTYMAKRQIGQCEAIYRAIPSMHLQDANISCTFVQSGYLHNQSKFLKKVKKNPKFQGSPKIDKSQGSSNNLDCNDDLGKHFVHDFSYNYLDSN